MGRGLGCVRAPQGAIPCRRQRWCAATHTRAWCGSLQFKDKANHVASHRLVFDSGTCAGRGLNCAVIDPSIDMFREPSSDPNVEYFTVAPTPLPAADNTA